MKQKGFTLAEILITLTVIGIVAAIVVPSLLSSINDKAWDAQRKALHARFSQAIAQLDKLDGYGTYTETTNAQTGQTTVTTDTAAATFVVNGLSKVYKMKDICNSDKLQSCGIPQKILNMAGTGSVNFPTTFFAPHPNETERGVTSKATKAVAFTTPNNESVAVFYNPFCEDREPNGMSFFIKPKICVNFIYDLNGKNGPNQFGKDIGFITAFYNREPVVVAPMPLSSNAGVGPSDWGAGKNASEFCMEQDSNSRLPDKEELAALLYNTGIDGVTGNSYWSSSIISMGSNGNGSAYTGTVGNGMYAMEIGYPRYNNKTIHCIKK